MEAVMATRKSSSDPKGRQPEALKTFGAASRSGSRKPAGQGLTAQPDTAPRAKDPAKKAKAAADVLKAGAEGRRAGTAAAKKASDR
jgi:hypothetical protein